MINADILPDDSNRKIPHSQVLRFVIEQENSLMKSRLIILLGIAYSPPVGLGAPHASIFEKSSFEISAPFGVRIMLSAVFFM